MLQRIKDSIPERSPIRLQYHKFRAQIAAMSHGFPANQLHVIGVTGTSGKSTTVDIIQHLLHQSGRACGSISTTRIKVGDKEFAPPTLRTTQSPGFTQKLLARMVEAGMQYVVIEVSSHAIDQHRLWGVNIDTAVLTNIYNNEHLDYHGTFQDYVATKAKLFKDMNAHARKPGIPKVMVLNADDEHFRLFKDFAVDKQWSFARKRPADVQAENVQYHDKLVEFDLRLPNNSLHVTAPIIGAQNLENLLCGVAVAISHGVEAEELPQLIQSFPGVPGRLEDIDEGQDFQVVVDFTYKPSALESVLGMLSKTKKGKLIVIWGGPFGRTVENYQLCGKIIDQYADQFILTTDDPGDTNPKAIAHTVMQVLTRHEGDGRFWNIPDRFEAIRYALMTAKKDDLVLIAGRGHETKQTIGKHVIDFDDRAVARDILNSMME